MALERAETNEYRREDGGIERPSGQYVGESIHPASFDQSDRLVDQDVGVDARRISQAWNCWINPWFLAEDRSLIGSPGKDERRNPMSGTKLSQRKIIQALWLSCLPLDNAEVLQCQTSSGKAEVALPTEWVRLFDLKGTVFDKDDDRLGQPIIRFVRWRRDSELIGSSDASTAERLPSSRAAVMNETGERILATIADQPDGGIPGYDELLLSEDYDRVELSGGFALVTDRNVFVIDDWGERDLCEDQIWESLRSVTELKKQLRLCTRAVSEQSAKLVELNTQGPMSRGVSIATDTMAQIRARLAALSVADAREKLTDPAAIRLHKAVCDRWQIQSRLEALNAQVDRTEDSVIATGEKRSSIELRLLGLFGLPLLGASNLSRIVADIGVHYGWLCAVDSRAVAAGLFIPMFVALTVLSFWLVNRIATPNSK